MELSKIWNTEADKTCLKAQVNIHTAFLFYYRLPTFAICFLDACCLFMDTGYLSQRLNAVCLIKMHVNLDTVAVTLMMCFCLAVIKKGLLDSKDSISVVKKVKAM